MGFLENELGYNVNMALQRQCVGLKAQIYRFIIKSANVIL